MSEDTVVVEASAEADEGAEQKAGDAIQAKLDEINSALKKEEGGDAGADAGADAKGDDADKATEPPGDETQLTARQQNAARRYGLGDEDLAALGDKAGAVLDKLAAAHSDIGRRYSEIGRAQRQAPPEKKPEGKDQGADPGEALFDPDVWGDEGSKANKAFAALRQEFASLREFVDEYRTEQRGREADEFFAGLPKGMYPELGLGRISDVGEDSPEAEARAEIIEQAVLQQAGHEAVRGKALPFKDALKEALAVKYPDAPAKAARQAAADAKKRRSEQSTARPGSPRGTERKLTPEEKAAKAIEQWEAKHGRW